MLWIFHFVMFCMFIGVAGIAGSAADDGHWNRAAAWGAAALLVLAVEILVSKFLPWFLGRDPYEE